MQQEGLESQYNNNKKQGHVCVSVRVQKHISVQRQCQDPSGWWETLLPADGDVASQEG